jgi:hypothetical protein
VKAAYRGVRDIFGEESCHVGADYSDVGDLPSPHPVYRQLIILIGPFDTQEVNFRMCLCCVYEKSSLSGADFNMQRAITSENIAEINLSADILGPKRNIRIIFYIFSGHLPAVSLIIIAACFSRFAGIFHFARLKSCYFARLDG